MKKKVLVVDDKINTLKVVCAILEHEGYTVLRARNGNDALCIFQNEQQIDAILSDMKMPDMGGMELFFRIRSMKFKIPFLIMTAHGSIQLAVEAMARGIYRYLVKPLNYDELCIVLEQAIREKKTTTELETAKRQIRGKVAVKNIIGTHRSMEPVFEMLETVAPTDTPVLVCGETGTGKELLARAIHCSSNRHDHPMVCINSAVLPDNLLEAELFGYKKGGFTGAITGSRGQVETANGGTLFLHDIHLMSLKIQTKLLHFLKEGAFDPVGGLKTCYADIRVIASTSKNLHEKIKANRFLNELLCCINVFTITLPPLRSRGDDLVLLINYFIEKYARRYNRTIKGMAPEAMEALSEYGWPGNIRELENCVARCVIIAGEEIIQQSDLPEKIVIKKTTAIPPFH